MLNELADEASNVGVVAVTDDPPRMFCRFIDDPTVKSRNDVRIRKEIVDRFQSFIWNQKQQFENANVNGALVAKLFETLRESSSGIIRVNLPRAVLTNDVEQEVDLLFKQWVAPAEPTSRRLATPRDPLGGLKKEASVALVKCFRQGYGTLHRKTFHRHYEVRGISHKNVIDLAMIDRNGNKRREHLFHHVVLLPNADESFNQAAGLSCRWVDIAARNHVDRDLTAILYKREGQAAKGADEAKELLNENNINVAYLHDVPRLAQQLRAQQELPLK
ncbi:MAG: DUF3037 domain-containing protein [Verrucomicrobiota bacterium]|nr:DUF3037 domain-containing protein [Verrucomicrobiota bacterium]